MGVFGGKRNIGNKSENIKCGNLKKIGYFTIMRENGNNLTVFNGSFVQENHAKLPNNFPQKGVRVIYPNYVVMGNG